MNYRSTRVITRAVVATLGLTLAAIGITAGTAQAAWNGSAYAPGATLDPECDPTTVNCDVQPSADSGANTNITALNGLTTSITVAQGGTGLSGTVPPGSVLLGNGSQPLTKLAPGTAGQVLSINGGGAPAWTDAAIDPTQDNTWSGMQVFSGGIAVGAYIFNSLLGSGLTYTSGQLGTTLGTSIDASELEPGAVTGAAIADGTITLDKLAQSGCATTDIAQWNGAIWTCTSASGVGQPAITAGSGLSLTSGVMSSDLGSSIDSTEIDDGTITADDIANGAITATNIADGAITAEKLSVAAKTHTVSAVIGTIDATVSTPQEQAIFVAPTNGIITKIGFTTSNNLTATLGTGTIEVLRKTTPTGPVGSFDFASTPASAFVPNTLPSTFLNGDGMSTGDVYSFKYNPGTQGITISNVLITIEYIPTEQPSA